MYIEVILPYKYQNEIKEIDTTSHVTFGDATPHVTFGDATSHVTFGG